MSMTGRERQFMCRYILYTLLVIALMSPGAVVAAYTDPLDLPAVKYPEAAQSLLQDVVSIGERFIAVGERGTIIYSDDVGASWNQADVETQAQLNAVFFVDAKQGWAVGEDSVIVHTADGGLTWQRQYEDRNASDKGPLLDLYFIDRDTGFAVGVYNKLLKTTDGGQTWQNWQEHIDNLDGWHLTGITANAQGTLYISGEAGFIYRSDDGGDTFAPEPYVAKGTNFGLLVREDSTGTEQRIVYGIAGQLVVCAAGPDSCSEIASGVESGLLGGTWLADGSAVIVGNDGASLRLSADLKTIEPFPALIPSLFGAAAVLHDKVTIVGYGGAQVVNVPTATAAPSSAE
jgi:photosystem II stability/assembly factor-like uncharacterized protein